MTNKLKPLNPGAAGAGFEALDALYDQHSVAVERWLRRLGVPAGDVEDHLHDVFVVALRKLPSFRGDCKVETWLFAITTKLVRRRKMRDRLRRSLTMLWLDRDECVSAPGSEVVESKQAVERLQAALNEVPEIYRLPLILFELEGHSGEQAAEMLGCSVQTLWVRLHRGRQRLKRKLKELGGKP